MAKIEIYARLRPTKNRFMGLKTSDSRVSVKIGTQREDVQTDRFSKAPGVHHDFKFARTFDESATQSEVFETVARKIVDCFIEGFNGTVFAYGQTSTGKTYTVEGSARRYDERGLILRTLSYLYGILEEKKKRLAEGASSDTTTEDKLQNDDSCAASPELDKSDAMKSDEGTVEGEVKVHISYMEIYQDVGFDLLNPGTRPGSLMLTLPKVQISERADGRVRVRDLSLHEAANEQVAMSLLFQGSTCRKVAETSLNQHSSRSHTIFTITLTTKQPGSEVILRSKLHLVDLAGSERVSKTGSDGRILQEAKHINLSLHHLEHVIVSLQQQAKRGRFGSGRSGYIPYRNSMLTMVLRDSLGGNCLTAMIATVSAEEDNILETIATLRFSQRVACISNTASRNEELDDKAVIKKLKKKVAELEQELLTIRERKTLPPQMVAAASSGESNVSDTERVLCHRVLHDFFHGRITNPVEAGINTPALFQECLHVLRAIVIDAVKAADKHGANPVSPNSSIVDQSRTDIDHKSHGSISAEGAITSEHGSSGDKETRKKRRSRTKEHKSSPMCDLQHSHITPSPTTHHHTPTTPQPQMSSLATPIPTSRLSSGIGSLHDEEDVELIVPSTPSKSISHSVKKDKHKSHKHSLNGLQPDNGNECKGHAGYQEQNESVMWAQRVLHSRMTVENESTMESTQSGVSSKNNLQFTLSPKYSGSGSTMPAESPNTNLPSPRQSSPMKTLTPTNRHKSRNSGDHFSPPATNVTENSPQQDKNVHLISPKTVSRQPLVVSPETRIMEQLQERRGMLQKSREQREQISDDVHLLSLRVEEEELKTQLQVIAEQLASQHARVLSYKQHRQDNPSQDMCAEIIAEQQLRIRQTRIHQKYLNVRQQIKSHQMPPNSDPRQISPHTKSPKGDLLPVCPPTKSPSVPLKSPPKTTNIAGIVNEVARTKANHSKVQEDIDQLRVSQVEKQLQLKEAATRRKIQELKQQLLQSPNTTHISPSTSPPGTGRPSPNHPMVESHTQTHVIPKSQPIKHPHPHSPGSETPQTIALHFGHSAMSNWVKKTPPELLKSPESHEKLNFTPLKTKPTEISSQSHIQVTPSAKHSTVLSGGLDQTSSNMAAEISPTPNVMVRERAYMTAVQCQKARVSRIRRCIQAATIIQRAWRTHREICIP